MSFIHRAAGAIAFACAGATISALTMPASALAARAGLPLRAGAGAAGRTG